jgi:hypothetical protein
MQFPSILALLILTLGQCAAQSGDWRFAVSGDSRNCGDVVMPAIAKGVAADGARFYWHLGDFRKLSDFDEDMSGRASGGKLTVKDYLNTAWDDFIQNQIAPFGSVPVFLAIGNHELETGHNRGDYVTQFGDWINTPVLQKQRLADDPKDRKIKPYYHWIQAPIDFITLDNASHDQFSPAQLGWFEGVLKRAASNPEIKTVVVGMHAALPDSLSAGHSMNEWAEGIESGRRVYQDLLKFRNDTHKNVYILASHSHFLMENIFNTDYLLSHGGVLPGWIVGTAGAERYRLPRESARAKIARTDVYGYLLANVHSDGTIDFSFREITQKDIPQAVQQRFQAATVEQCFTGNRSDFRP